MSGYHPFNHWDCHPVSCNTVTLCQAGSGCHWELSSPVLKDGEASQRPSPFCTADPWLLCTCRGRPLREEGALCGVGRETWRLYHDMMSPTLEGPVCVSFAGFHFNGSNLRMCRCHFYEVGVKQQQKKFTAFSKKLERERERERGLQGKKNSITLGVL